jgi:hypothetical protein
MDLKNIVELFLSTILMVRELPRHLPVFSQ